MWHQFSVLRFSSTFWIYADSGILTRFGPNSKVNTDSYPYKAWSWTTILDSHILLLGNECELQFYDLDQTHEPTLTLETKLDLTFIPESVSVPIPCIVEPKSSIPQNHIPRLDQSLDQYDSVMISQDLSYN